MYGCLRKRCEEEGAIEGTEIKNIAILTIAFQLVFTGFHALQNLHSSLHDEENLGLVALSVIYGTGIMSSVLSPTIIGLFGVKSVLVTSFAAHSIYILANFYASWATMIPAAIFLGILHGPAWTSQGVYVSACSFSYSKTSSSSPFSVLSKFNGFFFAVIATTQIVGNVFTSLVIRDGMGNKSEVIIYKYCGPRDCPEYENATQIEDPESWVIDLTLFVFLALSVSGLFLTFFTLTPLPRSEWIRRVSPKHLVQSFMEVLFTSNMSLLVPFIIFTGIEHAFLLGSFTKSYVACPIGIHNVGFVMSVYGITTPVFFLIFSKLVRVTGRFLLIMGSACLHLVILVFLLHWEPTEEDMPLIFLVPILWGLAESIQQAQANALMALLFPHQKEAAFANFHAWRSLGDCVTFLNVAYLCVKVKLIVCIICLVVGAGLYVFVEIQTNAKEKGEKSNAPAETTVPDSLKDESSVPTSPYSVASFHSIQERLSFDHFELADIIKDAELCWRRDDDGNVTLEVEKVMSVEHLNESKVTNLFHARPMLESLITSSKERKPKLPRSQSDAHLSSSRYRQKGLSIRKNRSRPMSANTSDRGSGLFSFQKKSGAIREDKEDECVYDSIDASSVLSRDMDTYSISSLGSYNDDNEEKRDVVTLGDTVSGSVRYSKTFNAQSRRSSVELEQRIIVGDDNGEASMYDRGEENGTLKFTKKRGKLSLKKSTKSDGKTSLNKSSSSFLSKAVRSPAKGSFKKMRKGLRDKIAVKPKLSTIYSLGLDNSSFVNDRGDSTKKSKKNLQPLGEVPDDSSHPRLFKRRKRNSLHIKIDNEVDIPNNNGGEKPLSPGAWKTHPIFTDVDLEEYKKDSIPDNGGPATRNYQRSHSYDSDGFVSELDEDSANTDTDVSLDDYNQKSRSSRKEADVISIY